MKLRPGTMITGRLRLVRPVGKGGMGSVWVAYHETLKTEVAIKLIEGEAKRHPKALARFEREAEIAARLKNPHVAQMFDHGTLGDGTPFIVMELLEGESLQERLRRGPLSLHETSLIVTQACQALGKAHKLGIIHRDVKPGNLFLIDTDYELFVKLLDFGIAKASIIKDDKELTKTGNLLGSPLYMSPEQFAAIKRVDLWSLAVVAYRCLAILPPFNGEALGNLILAVMQRDYQPITKLRSTLPVALDSWFERAFHADLEQRFQHAKEMATSLVEIARAAAGPGEARPSLPSITEMTSAALELNADTAEFGTKATTFSPASHTIDVGGRKTRIGLLAAAAVGLLAAGWGGYASLSGDADETGKAQSSAPETSSEPGSTGRIVAKAPEPMSTATALSGPAAEPISSTDPAPGQAVSTVVGAPVNTLAPDVTSARPAAGPQENIRPPATITRPAFKRQAQVPSDTGF